MTRSVTLRYLMLLCAWLCLALGLIGLVIPGLPTTVFILLAAWFASRGSPRLLAWLEQHRLFGPMILNWRDGGCVSRKAKWSATAMMTLCALVLALSHQPASFVAGICVIMSSVLVWLWRRPERQNEPI